MFERSIEVRIRGIALSVASFSDVWRGDNGIVCCSWVPFLVCVGTDASSRVQQFSMVSASGWRHSIIAQQACAEFMICMQES